MELKWKSKSVLQTQELAKKIASIASQGLVITLDGDLGAGKTTFTQGFAKGLEIHEHVSSPTFNILKYYFNGRLPLYHIDAYRLEEGTNIDIGLEEVIEGDGVCLIEWSNYIKEMIHNPFRIQIIRIDENEREFIFDGDTKKYQDVLNVIKEYIK